MLHQFCDGAVPTLPDRPDVEGRNEFDATLNGPFGFGTYGHRTRSGKARETKSGK
jgi:hypothetical protein